MERMILWQDYAGHLCWLIGCALALSSLSYASWQASSHKLRFRVVIATISYRISLTIAAILFCVGMAMISGVWWRTGMWLILGLVFIFQGMVLWRSRQSST